MVASRAGSRADTEDMRLASIDISDVFKSFAPLPFAQISKKGKEDKSKECLKKNRQT